MDFHGGAVDGKLPANAGEGGSIPAPGAHAMEQLSTYATATEPVCHNRIHAPRAGAPQEKSPE